MLLFTFCLVTLNITGCENKINESEVKPSQNESVQVNKYDDAYNKCMKSTENVNNTTVYGCSEASSELAEKDMNLLLTKIYSNFKDDEYKTAAFKEYQAAWEIYSNAEADFDAANIGTPQREITIYKNKVNRIEFLEKFLKDLN